MLGEIDLDILSKLSIIYYKMQAVPQGKCLPPACLQEPESQPFFLSDIVVY